MCFDVSQPGTPSKQNDRIGATPSSTINQHGDALTVDMAAQLSSEQDPAKRGEMFFNWLTGGGLPKHVDPSTIFAEGQAMAGTNETEGKGQGFYGLFGFGNTIGDLKADVPYSQPAVPKMGGK